ncbi:hypothetical protein SAMN05216562_0615 [Microbulbifer marinus]|uniref:Uncharacterized protein n=1 Tax=Microbulbifer marinus TaxID=658218 RepID=A0A1H3W7C9_9GAMM|nr:hypothetical protein SAMN05216562_0615 [Microbulbifer marinus]
MRPLRPADRIIAAWIHKTHFLITNCANQKVRENRII